MRGRILFTVEHLYPFGDARQLLPLAAELIRRQWDVVVVVLGQSTFDAPTWRAAGVRLFFANGDDQTPLHTMRDGIQVVRELRQIIQLVEPQWIHAWCGEAIWLTLLACQSWPWAATEAAWHLSATELQIRPPKNFLRMWSESRMSRSIETLVVPHSLVADQVLDAGLKPETIQVVPNGWVREPEFELALADRGSVSRNALREEVRSRHGIPLQAPLAVAIAELEPRTRLKDLIWATDLLLCIREDFYLVIIGEGHQRRRLKRFAAQTEVGDHVRLVGRPESPATLLAAADFYWHSHLQQPLPCNLLTAMSLGIPVVSVYGPGTEEVIRHQETGLATNFAARDEFARWTKFLLEQTDASERLAYQGQRAVEREFPIQSAVDAYEELFSGSVATPAR